MMHTGPPYTDARSGQLASNASRSMSCAEERKVNAKNAVTSVKTRVMILEVEGKFQ